jgi:hypothetical protein
MTKKRWSAVTRAMWTDERFLGLSGPAPNAQTLWLYLLTNPHQISIPGLLPLGAGAIADGLDWSKEEVKVHLKELESAGMIEVCHRPALIFLPNAIHHNQPANPNQIKGWRNGFDNLPDTRLRHMAILSLRKGLRPSLVHSFDSFFGDALDRANAQLQKKKKPTRNGSGNGIGNKEQEQEYIVRGKKQVETKPRQGPTHRHVKKEVREAMKVESRRLARVLRDVIATHSPDYIETQVDESRLGSWALVIDQMLRLDKAKPEEVETVIRWAHVDDQKGFWRSNLLSATSLRKQFTRLRVQLVNLGRIHNLKTIDDWKAEYGTWAIRIAERSLITSGSLDGNYLIEAAKLEGVPTPNPKDAETIASWAVTRV